jgi:hypothetical protein
MTGDDLHFSGRVVGHQRVELRGIPSPDWNRGPLQQDRVMNRRLAGYVCCSCKFDCQCVVVVNLIVNVL